ncbi:MAG: SlyX family protein [Gammaproteobacteria bacterium]
MNDIDQEARELRLAYLERTTQELGDVLYRQQREIEMLRDRLAACERALAARDGSATAGSAADERPPHY